MKKIRYIQLLTILLLHSLCGYAPAFGNTSTSATGYVFITEVLYDSSLFGYANYGQFIELYNAGDQAVNLTGWQLATQVVGNKSYTFPQGTVLEPYSFLVVTYGVAYPDPEEEFIEGTLPFFHLAYCNESLEIHPGLVLYQTSMPLYKPTYSNMERLVLSDSNGNVRDKLEYGYPFGCQLTADNSNCADCNGFVLKSLQRISVFFDLKGNVVYPNGCAHWELDPQYQTCTPLYSLINYTSEMSFWNDPGSLSKNYILTVTPTVETASIPEENNRILLDNLENAGIKVDYFDGLGRPLQTMLRANSPLGKNLISRTEYDIYGRLKKEWLPVAVEADFLGDSQFSISSTELYSDSRAYTEYKYSSNTFSDGVLKDELIGVQAPGTDMNNKYAARQLLANAANTVKRYRIVNDNTLTLAGYYEPKTLLYEQTTDEDGKVGYTYKNKQGQPVLTRQLLSKTPTATYTDTYYVYNDLGQLCYMIPPLASDAMNAVNTNYFDSDDAMKKYCYIYKYDNRGNQITARMPGCEPIYRVFDKANRLILSQDGNQRPKNQWVVSKYDLFGRLLYTGILTNGDSFQTLQNKLANTVVTESYVGFISIDLSGYSCNHFSSNQIKLLTVNYYDKYTYFNVLLPTTARPNLTYQTISGYGEQYADATGLLTGTRIYHLDKPSKYESSAIYYDYLGRIVQTRATNFLEGFNYTFNKFSFTGNPLKTLKQQNVSHTYSHDPGVPYTISTSELYEYAYDRADRLLTTTYTVNSKPPVVLASNEYDELGRLIGKHRHNGDDIEQFEYNIRNWPTKIKSGDFTENIYYNNFNLPNAIITPCYNGNISATTWTYNGQTNGYVYFYDGLNRMTGNYSILNNQFQDCGEYSETFTYDKHGNIKGLTRQNDDFLDILNMTYNGNQLTTAKDLQPNSNLYNVKEYNDRDPNNPEKFTYDSNGNMISDFDRNIVTIRYNLLNLPDTIQFGNGNQIINKYDASGKKLETKYFTLLYPLTVPLSVGDTRKWTFEWLVNEEISTFYVDNAEYVLAKSDFDSFFQKRVHNPEGYSESVSAGYGPVWHYYRRDHLGNNREVQRMVAKSGNQTIYKAATVQRTQYYPSGLPWKSNSSDGASAQPYKYQGKEFMEMHGLNMFDFHARMFDPLTDRTLTMDPLAEKYPSISPYAWCGNNPVKYIDPTGMDITIAGADSSSLVLKTDLINLTLNTTTNFQGNHTIADLTNIAIGYELGVNATAAAGVGTSYNAYEMSTLFLGGDYAGYWYDYIGAEAQIVGTTGLDVSVGGQENYFIAVNNSKMPGTKTPEKFAGQYYGVNAAFSIGYKIVGLNIGGQWACSENGAWYVLSLGASASVGPQGKFGGTIGGHVGGTKLLTPQKPTSERSTFDKWANWGTHLFRFLSKF